MWQIIEIFQWGFITKYLGHFGGAIFSFTTFILGAIILWQFMGRIQTGIMVSFLEDIWTSNFINFFASPLKVKEYLLGLILTSLAISVVGLIIMVLVSGLIFGYSFFIIGLYILPFLLVLFIFGVAMGIFITAIVFKLGPMAEWLGWPIPALMSIFVGVFYPVSMLPSYLQTVSWILPPTYVFDSIRMILSGNFNVGTNLLYGSILAIIYLVITYLFFLKVYKKNLKTGAISRFSSEAV
jgi:ABC-2 type transport system permease protein